MYKVPTWGDMIRAGHGSTQKFHIQCHSNGSTSKLAYHLKLTASPSTSPATMSNPSTSSSAQPTSPPAKQPFVSPPEHYYGNIGSYGWFLLQRSHVFDLQPTSYITDKSCIAYTMNLLIERAAQWATALWEEASVVLKSHTYLVREMRRVFDHLIQGSEATSKLFSCNWLRAHWRARHPPVPALLSALISQNPSNGHMSHYPWKVEESLIPTEALDIPKTINTVHGQRLAVITYRTLPIFYSTFI